MSQILTQYYKNYKKKKYFNKILSFALVLFAILIFIICVIVSSNKKIKTYSEKEFFIVYSDKFTLQSNANQECTVVSDKGGAGVIYEVENTKFVVVNIYLNSPDANKIKDQIKPIFTNSDILKLTAPKLSKNTCSLIENQPSCKFFYNTFYSFYKDLSVLVLDFDKGDISASHIYKQIMKYKQEFMLISDSLKAQLDNVYKEMYASSLLLVQQISSFFDAAFIANSVAKNLKKLYVNSIIEFVSMCESIK